MRLSMRCGALDSGAPQALRDKLELGKTSDCAYLSHKSAGVAASMAEATDAQMFTSTESAMRDIGFNEREISWIWVLLTVIIKVGNLSFGPAGAQATMPDRSTLGSIASLLRCEPVVLGTAIITRRIKAGSEFISTPNTVEQALAIRDGLAKAIYERAFGWIVERCNESLGSEAMEGDGLSRARFFIGILDIFGFEIFEVNSLEQLCINFTNE